MNAFFQPDFISVAINRYSVPCNLLG